MKKPTSSPLAFPLAFAFAFRLLALVSLLNTSVMVAALQEAETSSVAARVGKPTGLSARAELAGGSSFTLTSPIPITNVIGVAVSQNISAAFSVNVDPVTVNLTGPDTNGDGIPDKEQGDIASLPSAVDGNYVILVSESDVALEAVTALRLRLVSELAPTKIDERLTVETGLA